MNKRRIYLMMCGLLLCAFSVSGQVIQREVAYETITYKTFKVPCDIVIEEMSALDFVYLQTKPALVRQTKFVIADNWLAITHTYPQMPRYERDYEYQMGKSVTDKWGTTLYYHDGDEYYNLENEAENEDFLLDAEQIETYGLFNGLFDVSITEIQAFCDAEDIPYYIWGQKVLIVHEKVGEEDGITERTEIETDLEQLYSEMRVFRDDIHILTDRAEYQRVNSSNLVIPTKKLRTYYSTLPSETPYQITETEFYLSYQVLDEGGVVIVDMENDFPDFLTDSTWQYNPTNPTTMTVTIAPNPAISDIMVQFPLAINDNMHVKITNIMGTVYFEENIYVDGNLLHIDVNVLPMGMYYIVCVNNSGMAYGKFLKQ
jgi:hypothetical protein